jgi:hypothetical protein
VIYRYPSLSTACVVAIQCKNNVLHSPKSTWVIIICKTKQCNYSPFSSGRSRQPICNTLRIPCILSKSTAIYLENYQVSVSKTQNSPASIVTIPVPDNHLDSIAPHITSHKKIQQISVPWVSIELIPLVHSWSSSTETEMPRAFFRTIDFYE